MPKFGQDIMATGHQQYGRKMACFNVTAGDTAETVTGIVFKPGDIILRAFVKRRVAQAITIEVGLNGTSGDDDPDGILDAVSLNGTTPIGGTLLDGGQTIGALLRVDESGGDLVPQPWVVTSDSPLTYTLSGAVTTFVGEVYVEYLRLPA